MQTQQPPQTHSVWSGFHKKALKERQTQLRLAFPSLFGPQPSVSASAASSSASSSSSAAAACTADSHDATAPQAHADPFPLAPIHNDVADNMIENCVGTLGVPIGLALNFVVDGDPLVVPMVIEEPSVVAAVSGAAKTLCSASVSGLGFHSHTSDRNVIYAQVQMLDIPDASIDRAIDAVRAESDTILRIANEFCASMQKRGGGAIAVSVRKIRRSRPVLVAASARSAAAPEAQRAVGDPDPSLASYWLVVHVHIDVCDAMGANCASTVAEGVAPYLARITGGRIGFRIVSNLATERIATGRFRVPTSRLAYKGVPGDQVAERIVEAYEWACDDPYRAITNNKGIMNGIDAVAVATGQDWRAIEASAHAWAALGSRLDAATSSTANAARDQPSSAYRPLARYWIEAPSPESTPKPSDIREPMLCGELSLPICVGTSGGVLKTNPVYQYTLGMMGHPSSKRLAAILACVGLAQNFAALRALSTEGIQRGHMSLHARNIAIASGAPAHAIQECVAYMVERGRITTLAAQEYLAAHRLQTQISMLGLPGSRDSASARRMSVPLSMFFFEETPLQLPSTSSHASNGQPVASDRVTLNIAFASYSSQPVHIELTSSSLLVSRDPLVESLFGTKNFGWINAVPGLLDRVQLQSMTGGSRRSNKMLSKKLKLLSVLLNILTRRLLALHPEETDEFIESILAVEDSSRNAGGGTSSADSASSSHFARLDASGTSGIGSAVDETRTRHLSDSGLFRVDAYKAIDKIRARSGPNAETLLVGIPLFLALWQVFQYRVSQWVGDASLAQDLLDEQRHVIETLVAVLPVPANSGIPTVSLSGAGAAVSVGVADKALALQHVCSVLDMHAARFQSTLFLLCDAISMDAPAAASDTGGASAFAADGGTRLWTQQLRVVGKRLGREQAVAHDLAADRLRRDLELVRSPGGGVSHSGDLRGPGVRVVNAFLSWLVVVRGWTLEQVLLTDMRRDAGGVSGGVRDAMTDFVRDVSHGDAEDDDGLDWTSAMGDDAKRVVRLYRKYYDVLDLFE
ncbi:hydroxymethylglutaryl-coenzyme A reductase-domain-containing protein [Entophlyctis helioformis]|nr:hydroxymethylglutaryl-coenzyme A reductase-domain-containing protein [Entophlyctis helioformis]